MKILRFSGIVAGVHLLAAFLLFANPGCSSSTKTQPSPAETVTKADAPPPPIVVPTASTAAAPAPISFNTDSVRYSPTRPGTPAASTLEAEPVSNVTPASTYTVVGGDNLTVIAKKNQLTIAELAAANNLKTTATLHLGQKLIIPGKNPAPAKPAGSAKAGATNGTLSPDTPATAASKVPAEGLKHTVKPGESLGVIAQKYGVKVGDIAAANSITDPQKVKAGTELIIPGWQATGGKAPKAAPKAADDRTTTRASATPAPAPATVPTIDTAPRNQPSPGEVPVIQIEEAPAPSR